MKGSLVQNMWTPVKNQLPQSRRPIYMVAVIPEWNCTTDQYAGWHDADGTWARWPHKFPPTHWMYQFENPVLGGQDE